MSNKHDPKPHLELVRDCLARLGIGDPLLGYEELRGGISGSHALRVRLSSGPAVLKVTLATSEPYVVTRARREVQFYRSLAQEVPLRVPQMLSSYADDAFGSCLLLAAYQGVSPPASWREEDYCEVAMELARLHAPFWGKAGPLYDKTWLHVLPSTTDDREIEDAREAWLRLRESPKFQPVVTDQVYTALCAKLQRVSAVDAIVRPFSVTLCHGDCHIDNLLRDAQGRLVWADWQMVGVGHGPEDVSFFLQRAAAAGGRIPPEAMITTYHRHLQLEAGIQIPLAEVRRVMDAFELRTLLLQWPFYLSYAPAEQVGSMLERIEVLWRATL